MLRVLAEPLKDEIKEFLSVSKRCLRGDLVRARELDMDIVKMVNLSVNPDLRRPPQEERPLGRAIVKVEKLVVEIGARVPVDQERVV